MHGAWGDNWAWNDAVSVQPRRPNRVTTVQEAREWRSIIGDEKFAIVLRALIEGAPVWIFSSQQDITGSDLTPNEQLACIGRLTIEGSQHLVWVKHPQL